MVFVLLLFAIGQFVLSQTIAGKNEALAQLNAQIAQLSKTLSLAEGANRDLRTKTNELSASLGAVASERDAIKGQLDTSKKDLVAATDLNAKSAAQVELLNRELAPGREQLSKLSAALDLANANIKDKDVKIAGLGAQLNLALANKVNQLEKYRSEFFGKLREVLGARADIRVIGDRFVVPTDVLFDTGSADLNPGAQSSLDKLAETLNAVSAEIPSDLDWVVRIDGHTDKRPIHTDQFPSNWELSTARAVAIVKYLVVQGMPAHRLSANGFGQFQPLDNADTEAAYAKKRRLEIQLTNR